MIEFETKPTKVHSLDDRDVRQPEPEQPDNPLDSEKMKSLHAKLLGHFVREMDIQAWNRHQMHLDEECYDGHQWDPEDAAALEERGQKPIVYNVLAPTIDWVTGTEKRTRSDFKILPRRKNDGKPAQRKTEIIKYLSDVNRSQFDVSKAFEDAVIAGVGWVEDGVVGDPSGEPIYSHAESWRNVLWDSASTQDDITDARYVFRLGWKDVDYVSAMFPKRAHIINASLEDHENVAAMFSMYGDDAMDFHERELTLPAHARFRDIATAARKRLRLIECWFRVPVEVDAIAGGPFAGELFDDNSPGHRESIEGGKAELRKRMDMVMHCAIFTTNGMIWFGRSPYRHNRFPLTPVWGYRRRSTKLPYGMVRRLRDIQDDINKRASKALFILSTNKMIVEEGAAEDMDDLVEEAQRPNGVMVVKPGRMASLQLNVERELPQFHLEMMSRAIAMVQQASGVTDELLGRRTNASSGIAIQRKQDQGALATSALFDNLRLAQQVRGEKILSLVEQFMGEEKEFRITDSRGKPEFISINDGSEENDIVRSKADFIISEADWKATLRQAAVDELLEVVGKMAPVAPQIVMVMLDLIVEAMDIPNREEIVKRIRQLTKQPDPDADESDPQVQAAKEQEAKAAAFQEKAAMVELDGKIAKAERDKAMAAKTIADTVGVNVSSQEKAVSAATAVLSMPATIDVADHILGQSGFVASNVTAQPLEMGLPRQPAPSEPQPPQNADGMPAQLPPR